MNLYRIILVDDEEEVRKSIIKKIDWEAAGFQVAGDAENGEEALEKIDALEPDLILTDIRMPYMDGLALAERVRQRFPSMRIIIFSGYDDFEYAKQAIKLNVTEYILKPVNVEELTAILKRIKENLDLEIEQKRNVSLLRESYVKNLPVLREQFLNDLVSRPGNEETVAAKMDDYHIQILDAEKWVAAAINIEGPEEKTGKRLPLHQEKDLIPISVRQLVEEKLGQYCRYILFSISNPVEADFGIIAAIDPENSQTGLIDVLGDICKEARRILELSITIGVGHRCMELSQICSSYKDAVNALGYKRIIGSGGTIYINDVEPVHEGRLLFEGRDESELIGAVKFGPQEKIRDTVENLMAKMNDAKVHVRQRQAYMLSITNCMLQLAQNSDVDMDSVFEDAISLIPGVHREEDFAQWLLQAAMAVNSSMNRERDHTTRRVIEEAKQYIQDNYQDPELSVEKICRHLHMSPAYFSTMFKKETGQAYIAYLTEVRLNKAVELLNKTDDKTYVIAAKVGYQEQNYFSYVFKKRFGISPTKFRGAGK